MIEKRHKKKNIEARNLTQKAGFRSRSREPAINIDGSETLRHPVDILLLEVIKANFFYHSRNITKKFGPLFTKLLYFELWEPGANYKNRRLRNPDKR